jgi:hypothetical protein
MPSNGRNLNCWRRSVSYGEQGCETFPSVTLLGLLRAASQGFVFCCHFCSLTSFGEKETFLFSGEISSSLGNVSLARETSYALPHIPSLEETYHHVVGIVDGEKVV